ncbi:transposable element-derived 6 [Octopus vulgaris]|uniref:Transposable element-derived 6 n=1 Tax=Octopus vulgaris TaxID=6645 RepID=A0AA36AIJ9_OCTVU|nr:transposable element-derived 6 [Octopus vulgaris]
MLNRYNVGKFYDNLNSVMDLHNFECHDIYNADETGCAHVQQSVNVVAAQEVKLGQQREVLLILDNHKTRVSLGDIDLAKKNGVILLTIPPHTSHKLQLLDVSCYKPFKTA